MPNASLRDLRNSLPPVRQLFASREEAHAEMMAVFHEVSREWTVEMGEKMPSLAQFTKDYWTVWNCWQKYAPAE